MRAKTPLWNQVTASLSLAAWYRRKEMYWRTADYSVCYRRQVTKSKHAEVLSTCRTLVRAYHAAGLGVP